MAEQASHDDDRSAALARLSDHVLRFWNHDVLQRREAVVDAILIGLQSTCEVVDTRPLTLPSPPMERGFCSMGDPFPGTGT